MNYKITKNTEKEDEFLYKLHDENEPNEYNDIKFTSSCLFVAVYLIYIEDSNLINLN
jgi:hypothetical protein